MSNDTVLSEEEQNSKINQEPEKPLTFIDNINPLKETVENEYEDPGTLNEDRNEKRESTNSIKQSRDTKLFNEKSEEQYAEKDKVQYEELLSSAGEFGLYQALLLLSTFPFYMFGVYTYYSQMFITEVSSNHWCWIPDLEHLTYAERRDLAIPFDNSVYGYSRCTAYVANWTEVLETGIKPDDTWETQPCQNGWEFSSEIPYPTIASELGWVCDKSNRQAIAQSLFSVGSICGCILFGWVADRFGRIPAAVSSNLFGFVGGVASSFTNSFIQFTICRFIMGMAYDTNMIIMFVLVLEYCVPKYRSLFANVTFSIFYTLFVTTLPFMALALGHWQWIALATSVPLGIVIIVPFILPESPRWLVSKGRVDEAIEKIVKIGKVNKKPVSPQLIERFKWTVQMTPKEESLSIITMLKRPVLRNLFILMCVEYMCVILVFDGLLRNIGNLNFDFFASFALISLTELPSMLLLAFILDIFGRRWLTFGVMAVSSLFTFLTIFAVTGAQSVGYVTVARFGVNMSYGAVTQWAAEVLPTSVRGSGVAFIHICGFVALTITPYIVILDEVASWLPLTIIGLVAFLGAVLPLFLPETARKEMPATIDAAEELVNQQKFCEMPCVRNKQHNFDKEVHVNDSFEKD